MRKKIEWQWEYLDDNTSRAKVIGGWIMLHEGVLDDKKIKQITGSIVFIPDRDHEWTIIQPLPTVKEERKKIADDFS